MMILMWYCCLGPQCVNLRCRWFAVQIGALQSVSREAYFTVAGSKIRLI